MMTNDVERGEGGKKCPKFDDVICERPLKPPQINIDLTKSLKYESY